MKAFKIILTIATIVAFIAIVIMSIIMYRYQPLPIILTSVMVAALFGTGLLFVWDKHP